MGVRILKAEDENSNAVAVLYDSVTGTAFGPIWRSDESGNLPEELAHSFLEWATAKYGDLRTKFNAPTMHAEMRAWQNQIPIWTCARCKDEFMRVVKPNSCPSDNCRGRTFTRDSEEF